MTNLIDHLLAAGDALLGIDPRWAFLALLLQLGNLVCRSLTWRNVLAAAYPDERLSAYRVGLAYAVGVALNGYLPARGGEAVKVGLVRMQLRATTTLAVASSCSVVLVVDSVVGVGLLAAGWWSGVLPQPPAAPAFVTGAIHAPVVLGAVATAVVALVWFVRGHLGPRARSVLAQLGRGVAVLRAPGRYAQTVLVFQLLAWSCRIGVVFCMLAAFGIPAGLTLAALVVVVGGMSTLVPVPGGAGSQQALAVFVLSAVTAASTALSFSIGMQVAVTVVNTTVGMVAAMLVFGRLHPVAAVRAALGAATMRPVPEAG